MLNHQAFIPFDNQGDSSLKDLYTSLPRVRVYIFNWLNDFLKVLHYRYRLLEENQSILCLILGRKNVLSIYYLISTMNIKERKNLVLRYSSLSKEWIILFSLRVLYMTIVSTNALLYKAVINLFAQDRISWDLYSYTLMHFMIYICSFYLFWSIYTFYLLYFQALIRTTLIAKIYSHLFESPLPLVPNGELIDYIQIDAEQAIWITSSSVNLCLVPIQFLISLYIYAEMIGWAAIVGIIGVLLQLIISFVYGNIYQFYQEKIMKFKDQRVKVLDEILRGIIIIKQNTYQKYFQQKVFNKNFQIQNKRFTEMNNLKKQAVLQLLMNLIFEVIPIAVLYSTILIFRIFSLEAILMIARNYYILIYVISMIPEYLSQLLLALTSIQRLQAFLSRQRPSYASLSSNTSLAINIQGSFSWGQDFILKGINIKIPQGQTVLLLGPNGSGKSSLLYAILGELTPIGECKSITQGISFATQEPWILQSSIKQNILCGLQMDENIFLQLMKQFQLLEDLYDINRELTENGASLSGGQRKRVHLCRTAYQQSDIQIFDTPQGALDQRTQSRLVQAFNTKDKKTRIIASSTLDNFYFVDRVIILTAGKIIYDGNYQQACLIYPLKSIPQAVRHEDAENSEDLVNLVKIDEVSKNQEDRKVGYVDTTVFRSLFNLYGGMSVLVIACLIGWTGMMLRIYYQNELSEITKISDSEESTEQQRENAQSYYLILYPICTLGSTLSTFLLGLVLILQGIKASKILHSQIIETLLKGSIQYFYNLNQSSTVKNRLTNDLYQFDMQTATSVALLIASFYQVLTNLFACILLSSYKAYPWLLIYTCLYGYYTLKYIRIKLEMGRLQAVSRSPMITCFSETAQSIVFLRQKEPNYKNFFNLLNNNQKANINLAAIMGWYNQVTCLLQILVYLAIININYFDLSLSSEQATLSVYLCVQLSDTLSVLGTSAEDFYSQIIYLERCLSLLKITQEPIDINIEECVLKFDEQKLSQINISHLNLNYDDKIILDDITLMINHQEKIAIIGRTGCGKTSLMQCITRIISPSSGKLSITGLNYDDIDLNSIRGLFSVVSQDSFVFEASIRSNIDPNYKYTETEIIDKIKLYGLEQISLFQNIKTIIDGNTLSPGEKQMIQLFRTLLQNRQIVILDECTGNLDDAYSKLFDALLKVHLKDKCVIGVTHKIEQLDIFDQVILLKNGQIVAQGHKEQVLDKYFS